MKAAASLQVAKAQTLSSPRKGSRRGRPAREGERSPNRPGSHDGRHPGSHGDVLPSRGARGKASLRPARGDEALEASHVRVGDGGCPRHGEPGFSHLRKQLPPRLEVRDLHGAPQGESSSPEPARRQRQAGEPWEAETPNGGAWQASSKPSSGNRSFGGCVHVSSRGRSRSKTSQTQRSPSQPCSGERGLRGAGQPVPGRRRRAPERCGKAARWSWLERGVLARGLRGRRASVEGTRLGSREPGTFHEVRGRSDLGRGRSGAERRCGRGDGGTRGGPRQRLRERRRALPGRARIAEAQVAP